jgi:hypothetical protein
MLKLIKLIYYYLNYRKFKNKNNVWKTFYKKIKKYCILAVLKNGIYY